MFRRDSLHVNCNSQHVKLQYTSLRKYALCLLDESLPIVQVPYHYMNLSGCERINDSDLLCLNYFNSYQFSTISARWNKRIYNQGNYFFITKFQELLIMMFSIFCIFQPFHFFSQEKDIFQAALKVWNQVLNKLNVFFPDK